MTAEVFEHSNLAKVLSLQVWPLLSSSVTSNTATTPPCKSIGKETWCENSWSQDPKPWWYLDFSFMFFTGSSSGTPLYKVLVPLEFSSPGLWSKILTSSFSLLPLAPCQLPNTNKWNDNLSLNHVGTSFALALEWFTNIVRVSSTVRAVWELTLFTTFDGSIL